MLGAPIVQKSDVWKQNLSCGRTATECGPQLELSSLKTMQRVSGIMSHDMAAHWLPPYVTFCFNIMSLTGDREWKGPLPYTVTCTMQYVVWWGKWHWLIPPGASDLRVFENASAAAGSLCRPPGTVFLTSDAFVHRPSGAVGATARWSTSYERLFCSPERWLLSKRIGTLFRAPSCS